MTLKPFYNEESVRVGDDTYRLVINFMAIDAIETLLMRGFSDVLAELSSGAARQSLITKVLWGFLREHHSSVTLDEALSLTFGAAGEAMGAGIQKLLQGAFETGEPQKAEAANPPKRRGASKAS